MPNCASRAIPITTVIEHFKPSELNADAYKTYLEANSDVASRLASLLGDFLAYEKTTPRVEQLTDRLELGPKS